MPSSVLCEAVLDLFPWKPKCSSSILVRNIWSNLFSINDIKQEQCYASWGLSLSSVNYELSKIHYVHILKINTLTFMRKLDFYNRSIALMYNIWFTSGSFFLHPLCGRLISSICSMEIWPKHAKITFTSTFNTFNDPPPVYKVHARPPLTPKANNWIRHRDYTLYYNISYIFCRRTSTKSSSSISSVLYRSRKAACSQFTNAVTQGN